MQFPFACCIFFFIKALIAELIVRIGKAANAGGVAVSGLEMAQNSQRVFWTSEEVDSRLKIIMENCFKNALETAKEFVAEDGASGGKEVAEGDGPSKEVDGIPKPKNAVEIAKESDAVANGSYEVVEADGLPKEGNGVPKEGDTLPKAGDGNSNQEAPAKLPSLVAGSNIAGFRKVAEAMKAQGDWW